MADRDKCKAKRSDGNPCGSFAVQGGGGKCFTHTSSPELVKAREKARSAGGKRRAQQQESGRADVLDEEWSGLRTVEDCEYALTHVVGEVLAGRMGAREAQAATTAIKILLQQASSENRYNGDLNYDDEEEE